MPSSCGITEALTPSTESASYENLAATPAPTRVMITHQPKTMANAVPRLTLLTQVKPMAVKARVQIMKMSNAEATLYKKTESAGFKR